MAIFVLIHSPSVGPGTWAPVAARLQASGYEVVVPSLLTVGEGGPPFWPRVVAAVKQGMTVADPAQPAVLVAHSNAGAFMPVVAEGLGRPVACSIFVDAAMPARSGATPLAGAEFLAFLGEKADDHGRLPPWTEWWDESEVAPMFPDPQTRAAVVREQPRLPLAYYREEVPAPRGWDDHPCAYLLFSAAAYAGEAQEAGRRGWPVRTVAGEHLHQLVDPGAVAQALIELAAAGAMAEREQR